MGQTMWRVIEDARNKANRRITSDGRPHIAKVYGTGPDDEAVDEYAALIAAAPELLDVLQVLWEAHGVPYELAGRVEKAIAKATGRK